MYSLGESPRVRLCRKVRECEKQVSFLSLTLQKHKGQKK